jgi:hypothetical protein
VAPALRQMLRNSLPDVLFAERETPYHSFTTILNMVSLQKTNYIDAEYRVIENIFDAELINWL